MELEYFYLFFFFIINDYSLLRVNISHNYK